eukprot:335091-Rhodomonas_salina.3
MASLSLIARCLLVLAVAFARMSQDKHPFTGRTIHKNVMLRTEKDDLVSLRARNILSRDSNPHEEAMDSLEHREWLIHVKGPVHSAFTEKLRQTLDVEEVRYVPHNTFMAFTNGKAIQYAKEQLQEVVWVGVVMPHHKVSPELHPLVLSDTSSLRDFSDDAPTVDVFVLLSQPLNHKSEVANLDWETKVEEVVPYAKTHKLHIRSATRGDGKVKKLVISMREDQASAALQFLAEQHLTSWVERKEQHKLRNKWAKGIQQTGTANDHAMWTHGLQGQGEVIGIADTGIDMHHCFFEGLLPLPERPFLLTNCRRFAESRTIYDSTSDISGRRFASQRACEQSGPSTPQGGQLPLRSRLGQPDRRGGARVSHDRISGRA